MKFRIDHITPELAHPADFIFYFYRHADRSGAILSGIALRIEQMETSMKHRLEQSMDLQLSLAPRDSDGNVCFADSPDLRPEFRTTCGPIDLWDYYYALFHNPSWWDSIPHPDRELPLPSSDHFWNLSGLGRKLRRIHSAANSIEKYRLDPHISGGQPIIRLSDTFRSAVGQAETGRLYLNDQDYIDHVPRRAWTFHLGEQHFLPDYLAKHSGHYPDSKMIRLLMEWIAVLDRTAGISAAISIPLAQSWDERT